MRLGHGSLGAWVAPRVLPSPVSQAAATPAAPFLGEWRVLAAFWLRSGAQVPTYMQRRCSPKPCQNAELSGRVVLKVLGKGCWVIKDLGIPSDPLVDIGLI